MNNIQLSFNLTGKCNIDCSYCAARKNTEELTYRDMLPETIIKSYSAIRRKHTDKILDLTCMGRGEPLLNWEGALTVDDIAREDKNTRCFTITNGTLHVRDKLITLAEKGWIITISYDGIMNEIERKGANHTVVEETIKELINISNKKTIIKTTITPFSLRYLKESLTRLKELGAKYIMFGPVTTLGRYEGKSGILEDSSRTISLLENIIYAEKIGLKPLLSISKPCGLATSGYYVLPDGSLSICYLKQIKPTDENRKKAQEQGCLLYNLKPYFNILSQNS